MRRQLSGKITGANPLAYVGSTPNMVFNTRRPTTQDFYGFELGCWWLIPKSTNGSVLSEEMWVLVGLDNHVATWKRLRSGGGPTEEASVKVTVYDTPGSGIHTFDNNMVDVQVECVGGGGGSPGFGFNNLPNGNSEAFPGAGGGAYCRKLYTSSEMGSSQPYTVGNGGAGGVAEIPSIASFQRYFGDDGGDTTFGASLTLITAGGGDNASLSTTNPGGVATGGDINLSGGSGGIISFNSTNTVSGSGGNSGGGMGFGGNVGSATVSTVLGFLNSVPGENYGGGAVCPYGVVAAANATGTIDGAAGGSGIIIITEYLG